MSLKIFPKPLFSGFNFRQLSIDSVILLMPLAFSPSFFFSLVFDFLLLLQVQVYSVYIVLQYFIHIRYILFIHMFLCVHENMCRYGCVSSKSTIYYIVKSLLIVFNIMPSVMLGLPFLSGVIWCLLEFISATTHAHFCLFHTSLVIFLYHFSPLNCLIASKYNTQKYNSGSGFYRKGNRTWLDENQRLVDGLL